MTVTAALLRSLDVINAETVTMLHALEMGRNTIADENFREAKRRALELRAKSQELFEWIAETRLETTVH